MPDLFHTVHGISPGKTLTDATEAVQDLALVTIGREQAAAVGVAHEPPQFFRDETVVSSQQLANAAIELFECLVGVISPVNGELVIESQVDDDAAVPAKRRLKVPP